MWNKSFHRCVLPSIMIVANPHWSSKQSLCDLKKESHSDDHM